MAHGSTAGSGAGGCGATSLLVRISPRSAKPPSSSPWLMNGLTSVHICAKDKRSSSPPPILQNCKYFSRSGMHKVQCSQTVSQKPDVNCGISVNGTFYIIPSFRTISSILLEFGFGLTSFFMFLFYVLVQRECK